MVGRTSSGPNRRAIPPSTRLRQDGRRRGTDAPALRNRSSQNAMWTSSIAARLAYTLASRGSASADAIARYSAALSTSSCQFSRYRGISARPLMSPSPRGPLEASRVTVTAHESFIQGPAPGAAAVSNIGHFHPAPAGSRSVAWATPVTFSDARRRMPRRTPRAAPAASRSATSPPPSTRAGSSDLAGRIFGPAGRTFGPSDFGYNHAPVTILWDTYRSALGSIAQAVGRTPLVTLNRVTAGLTPPIHVKLEWYGATGSLKDRIYLHMFDRAEARGDLRPGMRVLECSTGNAGIACAFVAAVKGYRCTIVMPEGMSEERKKIMRAYGADLVFTPGGESDVDLSLRRLEEIRAGDRTGYWVPGQFDNADNVEAHYRTTGPELWEQAGGIVGAFVASQGSGGTLTGVGRYLRERDTRVRLYAVEPEECALLARREWGPHGIEGIGDGVIPENLDVAILSGVITAATEESLAMARRLAAEEGIFCGISTGCNVAAALKLARHRPDLPSIVTMVNDTGQRYFTTGLCGEAKHVDVPARDHPMDARTREALDRYQAGWELLR